MSSTPKRSSKQSEPSVSDNASYPASNPDLAQESVPSEDVQTPELVRPVRPAVPKDKPLPQTPKASSKATQLETSSPALSQKPVIPESTSESPEVPSSVENDAQSMTRLHPIPPPSERMQYRAIGLIRGKYKASDEQLTRGQLVTTDGTEIDAVLLGRIISLIKKHIDLEEEHLWVVYPRTREKESDLHAQIAGIWEPEKLHQSKLEDSTAEESESSQKDDPEVSDQSDEDPKSDDELDNAQPLPSSEFEDGYFSIRGEVVYQSEDDDNKIIVKIRQKTPQKAKTKQEKAFKLLLQGELKERALGKFWDFQVKREADMLVIQSSSLVGIVPPKKKAAGGGRPPRKPGGARKPWQASRPGTGAAKPSSPRPQSRKDSVAKPLKRKDKDLSSGS